ncbi:histidine phosphatase family protein [Pelagibius sp.]|uniref:histidine phosphatase family protein n=1 Tax=Pelagibius sp. TaxID=1931238 RepID=UPI003B505F13
MRASLLTLFVVATALLATKPVEANPILDRLTEPGTHAILRHALAPGTGDPADFTLGDCTTQRNLDDVGRAQARAIGAAVRDAGIAIDHVLTSQWCRTAETALLLDLGPVTEAPMLNSFFRDRSTADSQTVATAAALAELPPGETAVLVTHQVNITALTGVFPRSGEMVLLRVGKDGDVTVLDRVLLAD